MTYYKTKRLILRQWQEADLAHFIALNQDPEVMRFLQTRSEQETISIVKEFMKHLVRYGFTIYACTLKSNHEFMGFIGLWHRFDMPFSPCVEIGWRLDKKYWGQGFAVEAADKCLEIGFLEFNLDEIVSFCSKINIKSERVMQKIGMNKDKEDFYHYKFVENDPLSLHVLYRIKKQEWMTNFNIDGK